MRMTGIIHPCPGVLVNRSTLPLSSRPAAGAINPLPPASSPATTAAATVVTPIPCSTASAALRLCVAAAWMPVAPSDASLRDKHNRQKHNRQHYRQIKPPRSRRRNTCGNPATSRPSFGPTTPGGPATSLCRCPRIPRPMLGACASWLRLARYRLHDVYAAAGRNRNSNGYKHNPRTTACSIGIGSALLPV